MFRQKDNNLNHTDLYLLRNTTRYQHLCKLMVRRNNELVHMGRNHLRSTFY